MKVIMTVNYRPVKETEGLKKYVLLSDGGSILKDFSSFRKAVEALRQAKTKRLRRLTDGEQWDQVLSSEHWGR